MITVLLVAFGIPVIGIEDVKKALVAVISVLLVRERMKKRVLVVGRGEIRVRV